MSWLFYATALARTSDAQGSMWATVDHTFPRAPIRAVISLSSCSQQNGESWQQFQPHFAYAYIVTEQTPVIQLGPVTAPNPDKLRDNHVHLETDHLSFNLQVENMQASAVGTIYDVRSDHDPIDPASEFELATYDDAGTVVGSHRFVQFPGGRAIDPDEAGSQLLLRLGQGENRPTGFTVIDRSTLGEAPFRIDTTTGLALPTGG